MWFILLVPTGTYALTFLVQCFVKAILNYSPSKMAQSKCWYFIMQWVPGTYDFWVMILWKKWNLQYFNVSIRKFASTVDECLETDTVIWIPLTVMTLGGIVPILVRYRLSFSTVLVPHLQPLQLLVAVIRTAHERNSVTVPVSWILCSNCWNTSVPEWFDEDNLAHSRAKYTSSAINGTEG